MFAVALWARPHLQAVATGAFALMSVVVAPLVLARARFRCPRCGHRFGQGRCASCDLPFGTPKPAEREVDGRAEAERQRRAEAERAEAARWGPSTQEVQERDRRSHDTR